MQYISFWLLTLLLAGASAAYLLYPILGPKRRSYGSRVLISLQEERLVQAVEERDNAYAAISELDLDLAAGNLNEVDYQEMRTRYKGQAVAALIALDQEQTIQNEQAEAIEKAVSAVRVQLKTAKGSSKADSAAQRERNETKVGVASRKETRVKRYCKICKHETGPGAVYCANCGVALALPKETDG